MRHEQNIHFVAEAQVLRALADVESELGFALAGVARVESKDSVFKLQSREPLLHGLAVHHPEVQEFHGDLIGARPGKLPGVGAGSAQHGRDARLVFDFHQEHAPALLDELGLRRPLPYFHSAFGIDVHAHQAIAVEDLLHLGHGPGRVAGA